MNQFEKNYINHDNEKDSSFKSDDDGALIMFLSSIFPRKYRLSDMRDAYISGKTIGFEIGLNSNSQNGRELQLSNNITNSLEKEFYDNFLSLCKKYDIRISYHPLRGLCFEKL